MSSLKRIKKEFDMMEKNPPANFSINPTENDYYKLQVTIFNLRESPYEGGYFMCSIQLPKDYPFYPPKIKFQTKIYHPNINTNGDFSVGDDMCYSTWSPKFTVIDFMNYIISIILKPNADDPLVPEVANVYKNNNEEFKKTAHEWTIKYAM